jgi:NADPH:quinone reductase-like Zn-dependent oxidoreductase
VSNRLMKAIRIHQYGGLEVVIYEDAPVPEIGPDDVLIKVCGAAVNPADWRTRNGQFQTTRPLVFPAILGLDVSGTVEAVGSRVSRVKLHDAVIARAEGTFAEYVAVRAEEVARAPTTIALVEAAAIPVAAGTAWLVLFDVLRLTAGQSILIHGGAGGIGSFAVQLAKRTGAYVIATASGRNVELVRSLGADQVVDYRSADLARIVTKVNIVVDLVGPDAQEASWPLLREGGRLVSIVFSPDHAKASAHKVIATFGRGSRPIDGTLLDEIVRHVDEGALRVIIGQKLPLSEARRAIELSEHGGGSGKVILQTVSGDTSHSALPSE